MAKRTRPAARADIIVTQHDLRRFAEHVEGTTFTSSLCLYAERLSEQEDCSVLIVTAAGAQHERIDRQQMQEIARSLARIEAGLSQPRLRLRRAPRPKGATRAQMRDIFREELPHG